MINGQTSHVVTLTKPNEHKTHTCKFPIVLTNFPNLHKHKMAGPYERRVYRLTGAAAAEMRGKDLREWCMFRDPSTECTTQ